MKPILHFIINNQIIERTDAFVPVRSSKNYLYAEFEFQTDDWDDKSKTVLFRIGNNEPIPILLGETNTCLVPAEVLQDTSFSVSIIAGNLITANIVTVKLYESGYRTGDIPEPSQTLYEQLMTAFGEAKQTVIDSAKESESWAHGHTDYPERKKDNAAYYASEAKNAVEEVPGRVKEGKKQIDDYVKEKESQLKGDIAEISEVDETDNKYNPFSDECIDESYLQTFDIIEDTRLKISNKIHVKKGDIVRFIKNSFTNKNAGAIYNTNGLPQVSIYSNGYTEETWNDYVICASVSPIDGYYLVNMEKRGDATVNMIFVNKSFPADGKFVPYHRERIIRKSCIEKYIEPFGLTANVLNGNYEEVYSNIPLSFNKVDGYYNKNGKFFANEGYEEAVVDVKKGEKYYLTSYNYFQIARAFFRDSSGTFVGSVYTANNNKLEENTEVAIPENAVTMHLQRLTNKRVELLGKTGYELIARVNEVSPLYGKKLVTAGDSYTHASFSGNYAEYDGKNYGYYVAKRHGMTFINSGMSGSIMALDKDYVANPTSVPITSRNPFSYQRYLDVPEDTDYLTIWFGINDNAHTNLGTIDDATNETFYGAWNKVLRYYLTKKYIYNSRWFRRKNVKEYQFRIWKISSVY